MRDNNEGGSQEGGFANQQAADASATGSTPTLPTVAGTGTSDDAPTELRPVSADMHQFIGRQLRAVFDDVAKQPVPDRFLELMKQLDGKTSAG
ncbi:NepR family anti-sigma factor [Lichenihabitans sp. Uapishka_5]|uniref:NepR family anti-sigma factor n=1 Tax=Lichenihabitans sp. Uapishka_5 TaxID=3037302 RepID=UPI0029E818C2|nr:NepR family anti-sigma factor [Lichenihabitans sp. Uapishka_5]